MGKPCRPELRFASLDDLLVDVDQLVLGDIEQCGQWSLPMVLDHLNKWTTVFLDGGIPRLPGPMRWIARWMFRRMVRKQKYPSFKLKAMKALQPVAGSSEAVTEVFRQMVERVKRLPGPVVETIPVGELSLRDFQQMLLLHAAHHLAFLQERNPRR